MYQHAELVHWMSNKDTMKLIPAQVDIDLTNICNQDCFYCNNAEHRAQHPVQKKYTEYIELLDKLASWRSHSPNSYGSLHTITFTGGGEPTVLIGYERVVEHAIDLGFLVSIITNGSNIHKLIENVHPDKIKKISWIGIDIDAGDEITYEKIRRSLTKNSLFNKVMENSRALVNIGATVDFKFLLNEHNDNRDVLEQTFIRCKEIGVRMLYIRPIISNNAAYVYKQETLDLINELKLKYDVSVRINFDRAAERNYTRCHQMFQFPVMCATGDIVVCCENKGNPNFSIGRWDEDDFRDIWLSTRHWDVYNKTNTKLCLPCRPNKSNNQIQKIINDPSLLESLNT